MADVIPSQIPASYSQLKQRFGDRVDVPIERRFIGFNAYQSAMAACDIAVLATPPGFRPSHFEEAVTQGKHVFMENPVATDAPGVRRILAAAATARAKNLKVATGLQRRYDTAYLDTVRRLQDGAIGSIAGMRCYWNSAPPWVKTRIAGETEMQYQLRNWYHFVWLSGDHVVEQHSHNLDVANWVLGSHPLRCWGNGGRQVRTGKDYGEIFDHFSLEYEYANGVRLFSSCRQIPGCWNQVGEHCIGYAGTADVGAAVIQGPQTWRFSGSRSSPYQMTQNKLVEAIRNNHELNDAEEAARSTLTAILGRMATYSGKEVTWDQALNSNVDLFPRVVSWDALPKVVPKVDGTYPIAIPGAAFDI